jgi:hypothetical protein
MAEVKMPDELVKSVMRLFVTRKERKAVKQASTLRFWKDGMLKQLELIRDGKATPETFEELRKYFDDGEARVGEALENLRRLRNQIGGGPVANAINDITDNSHLGKSTIRSEIKRLLDPKRLHEPRKPVTLARKKELDQLDSEWRQSKAKLICLQIEALNAALDRLYRLVYE